MASAPVSRVCDERQNLQLFISLAEVRFVIDPSGHVPAASIGSSELQAPELGCCVVKRVAQWTFPKPESAGFVVVEYPFVVHISKGQ